MKFRQHILEVLSLKLHFILWWCTKRLKCFCTMFHSLRCDTSAICAPLEPIIQQVKLIISGVKNVHFYMMVLLPTGKPSVGTTVKVDMERRLLIVWMADLK
ncbi:hypothetical protein PR048_010331 [Dryococelus australis]|uniref:Secreted protein n=1 Tax=Dryococelus australis TaxID=614101 RepID=A0ABQ9I2E3_9NEOP|nr:hypothetical protein PR048_010331 [Dryococelus australis]